MGSRGGLMRSGERLPRFSYERERGGGSLLQPLKKSSSVPTIGLRRTDALPPRFSRQPRGLASPPRSTEGNWTVDDKSGDVVRLPLGKSSRPEPPPPPQIPASEAAAHAERERKAEEASKTLWQVMHGAEFCIKEMINLRAEDPAAGSLKSVDLKLVTKAIRAGGRLEWKNDDWDGATLLLKAVRTNNFEVVQYLVALGAETGVYDKSGRGLLHWAAMEGSKEMMHYLLEEAKLPGLPGCVNEPDNGGDCPIHLAAYHGHLPVMRLLLRRGAKPDCKSGGGHTPYELAQVRKMWHITNFLDYEDKDKVRIAEMAIPAHLRSEKAAWRFDDPAPLGCVLQDDAREDAEGVVDNRGGAPEAKAAPRELEQAQGRVVPAQRGTCHVCGGRGCAVCGRPLAALAKPLLPENYPGVGNFVPEWTTKDPGEVEKLREFERMCNVVRSAEVRKYNVDNKPKPKPKKDPKAKK